MNETLWYAVTEKLGCGSAAAAGNDSSVACMRTKGGDEIMEVVGELTKGSTTTGFVPTADEKLVPTDIANRSAAGEFIKKAQYLGSASPVPYQSAD